MPPIDFSEIFKQLKDQVIDLAKLTVNKFKDEAIADAHKLLDESKEDLERWTKLLAEGSISSSEFEFLAANGIGLFQMSLLQNTILAKVKIDQFRNSVLNLIINTIFDKIIS